MDLNNDRFHRFTKYPLATLLVLLTVLLLGCGKSNTSPYVGTDDEMDIMQVMQEQDDLSTLYQSLTDADLDGRFSTESPLTLFAPTNAAFDSLPDGFLDSLSQDQLQELFTYHALPDELTSESLGQDSSLQSIQKDPIFVEASGTQSVLNRSTRIVQADLEASNGVIHKVNEVLMPDIFLDILELSNKRRNLSLFVCKCTSGRTDLQPVLKNPDARLTVFIPTDAAFEEVNSSSLSDEELKNILEYHIVETAKLRSDELSDGQTLTTRNGADLTVSVAGDGTISLNDGAAVVQTADLEGTNGVAYIIDAVLMPPNE